MLGPTTSPPGRLQTKQGNQGEQGIHTSLRTGGNTTHNTPGKQIQAQTRQGIPNQESIE